MKIGVIDVGGSLKAAYAAGVLEYCLESGIEFDVCVGVSVGCANLSSYVAKQCDRNFAFYREYSKAPEYMSYENFAKLRCFFDLDYIYGTLINSDGISPLDYDSLINSEKVFKLAATDAETGEVKYFDKSELVRDDYAIIKAACALPYLCKPQNVYGKTYIDGTVSDPIPIDYALSLGCDKTVVLLADPVTSIPDRDKDVKLANKLRNRFPRAAAVLDGRARVYEESLKKSVNMQNVLILAPRELYGVDTMVRSDTGLEKLFADGYRAGREIPDFLNGQIK